MRGRRARVQTNKGYLVVMVVGEYRGQWRVKRADYPICRPSGVPLGNRTMLVPKWATRFVPRRKTKRA